MRRAGVGKASILIVYLTTIRQVLQYAGPVWQSVPVYLADVIVSAKKGSLDSFPYGGILNTEALGQDGISIDKKNLLEPRVVQWKKPRK